MLAGAPQETLKELSASPEITGTSGASGGSLTYVTVAVIVCCELVSGVPVPLVAITVIL